ncbi:VOC family protein [Kordiimonas aquimaris]|uniref:VOC family protein n=1 Tax=Kordiimonas aquimaris TaxID=707591 RepID=UPI0021D237DA|nr:VOC family protein [Kordiimonas aquimaris]
MTRPTSASPKVSAEKAKATVTTKPRAKKVAQKAASTSQTKAKKQPQIKTQAKAGVKTPAKPKATKPVKTVKAAAAKSKRKAAAKAVASSKASDYMPKGYNSVTPSLIVRDAANAIAFYADVFGATELSRTYGMDGITILTAALKVGDSIIHISDEMPLYGIVSPTSIGGTASALQVYVEDVDATWERAVAALSVVLLPLEDAYWGERTGKLIDPYGHVWTIAKKVEEVSAAELEARFNTLYGTPVDAVEEESLEVLSPDNADEAVKLVDISEAIATDATYTANTIEAHTTLQ